MALSGAIYGDYVGNVRISLGWTASKISGSSNGYSLVCTVYVANKGSSQIVYPSSLVQVDVNGTPMASVAAAQTIAPNSNNRLAVLPSFTVYADSDGATVAYIEASYRSFELSGTGTVGTPRTATTPTISGSKTLGGSITISTSGRESQTYSHDLYYSWGAEIVYVPLAYDVNTSYTWTIPKTLAESIQALTAGDLWIRCDTYAGTELVGTTSVKESITVPNTAEFKPTINSVSFADYYVLPVNRFVQGKTKLNITVNAVGGYVTGSDQRNSYPVSATITVDGKTYAKSLGQAAAASWTLATDIIQGSGTLSVVTTVVDSRGRTATNTSTVTVYAYTAPVITSFVTQRCTSTGVIRSDGTYITSRLQVSISPIDNQNAKTYRIVQVVNGSEVTLMQGTFAQYTNAVVTYNSYAVSPPKEFPDDESFVINCYVTDSFNSSTPSGGGGYVPTAEVFMDWRNNGKGIAFGKVSSRDGVEFGWNFYDKNNILNGFQSMTLGDGNGHVRLQNGLCIQWGSVAITPLANNAVTQVQINFPIAYASRPHIGASAQTNAPQAVTMGVGAGTTAAAGLTGMIIYMTRTYTTSTTFRWWAIGRVAAT